MTYREEKIRISVYADMHFGDETHWSDEILENEYRRDSAFSDGEWNSTCSGSGSIDGFHHHDENLQFDYLESWTYNPDCATVEYSYDGSSPETRNMNAGIWDVSENPYSLEEYIVASEITDRSKTYEIVASVDDGFFQSSVSQHYSFLLSDSESGEAAIAEVLASIDPESENWVASPGLTATAWIGNWTSEFSFNGRAVRYRARFHCLPDDADLEFTYRVWPIGGNQESDGEEETETENVRSLQVEDAEDGSREVVGHIIPKNGYYKRLIKVAIKGECSGGSNHAGNSNGGSTGSMRWWVSLGTDVRGHSVGNLRIEQDTLDAPSATPAVLRYDGGLNPAVKVLRDEWGTIQQVLAPEVFVKVVVVDEDAYELHFYPREGVEAEEMLVMVGGGTDSE